VTRQECTGRGCLEGQYARPSGLGPILAGGRADFYLSLRLSAVAVCGRVGGHGGPGADAGRGDVHLAHGPRGAHGALTRGRTSPAQRCVAHRPTAAAYLRCSGVCSVRAVHVGAGAMWRAQCLQRRVQEGVVRAEAEGAGAACREMS